MKTKFTLALLTLLCAAPVLPAEPPSPPPAKAEGPREKIEQRLRQLAQELNLSEGQKTQVAAVIRAEGEKLKALREDDSLRRRKKLRQLREIRESAHTQIRALLTPEQQAKFDAMPRPRRGETSE